MGKPAPGRLRSLLVAAIWAAGGIFLPALSVHGETADPRLAIMAPAEGASLPKGRVLVIVKAVGEGMTRVEVDVNAGGKQSAAVRGGGVLVPVTLAPGKNVIRASAGKKIASVVVFAEEKAAGGRSAYVYHKTVEKCADCHAPGGRDYSVRSPRDSLCYRCHGRKDKGRLAHGPMGSGDCTACHDPHGSAYKGLAKMRTETLCIACHDQKSTEVHIRKSKGKSCTACHDPHSSDKPFLQK